MRTITLVFVLLLSTHANAQGNRVYPTNPTNPNIGEYGSPEKAIAQFQSDIDIRESRLSALRSQFALINLELSRLYSVEKNWQKAAMHADQSYSAQHPKAAKDWFHFAKLYLLDKKEDRFKELIRDYLAQKDLHDSDHIKTRLNMLAPSVFEDQADLIRIAEKFVEKERDPWYVIVLGVTNYRAGNFQDAEKQLKSADWRRGTGQWMEPIRLYGLALTSQQLNKQDEAKQWLQKADTLQNRRLPLPPWVKEYQTLPENTLLQREAHQEIKGTLPPESISHRTRLPKSLIISEVTGFPYTLRAMNNLATSYDATGRQDEALEMREELLNLCRKVLGPEHPDTLSSMHNLATSYDYADRKVEASRMLEGVLRLRRKVLGPVHPDTLMAMNNLAKFSAGNPDETVLAMKVATLQVWFRQEADHLATSKRMLKWVQDSTNAGDLERVAKLTCLLPISDPTILETVLTLAARSVEIGQNSPGLPYYEMALGMAEYRAGHYTKAEDSLITAVETASETKDAERDRIEGTANFYRAMSLFQQGKPDEARTRFKKAEATMKPLPPNAKHPLNNVDDLILWLAYKEAKALLADEEVELSE